MSFSRIYPDHCAHRDDNSGKQQMTKCLSDLHILMFKVDNLPSYNRLNIVSPYGVARDDEPAETLK